MSQSLAPEEAARFRRLPFYLEHKLLLQKFDGESEWEFEVTDPTWQAICWYYCFALRLALAGKTEPALDVVLKALERQPKFAQPTSCRKGPRYACMASLPVKVSQAC